MTKSEERSKDVEGVSLAPVAASRQAPAATRSDEDTAAAEGRVQVDQDPDYHKNHPTLNATGPEHDPKVQQRLREAAAKAAS